MFWYDLVGNPVDRFCCIDAHLYSCKCGPNPQTWFMWYVYRRRQAPLDYSWLIPSIANAEGIRTKNNTPPPPRHWKPPWVAGRMGALKEPVLINAGPTKAYVSFGYWVRRFFWAPKRWAIKYLQFYAKNFANDDLCSKFTLHLKCFIRRMSAKGYIDLIEINHLWSSVKVWSCFAIGH